MVHTISVISPLSKKIDDYFSLLKGEILALTAKQWNDEDLKGKSYTQWSIMMYYYLLYMLVLLDQDITRLQSLNKPYSYFVDKYKLNELSKCLACNNIGLSKALNIFAIPSYFPTDGIETMEVEETLVVEQAIPDPVTSNASIIINLLSNPNQCINYIQNN